jgi:hypothetical protein
MPTNTELSGNFDKRLKFALWLYVSLLFCPWQNEKGKKRLHTFY